MKEQKLYVELDFSSLAVLLTTGMHMVRGIPEGCRYVGSEPLEFGQIRLLFARHVTEDAANQEVEIEIL